MITVTHYATAECDACKTRHGVALATAAEQRVEIEKKRWIVRGDKCYCPKCVRVFRQMTENPQCQ